MKKEFALTRHLQLSMYLYGDHYRDKTPIIDNDVAVLAGMWHLPVLDFDLSGLKGKKIESAILEMQAVVNTPPMEIELTSVSQQWSREHGTYYRCDEGKPWAGGSIATEVLLGRGNSVFFRQETRLDAGTGILSVDVNPELIYAMANGLSSGIGLLDGKSRPYASKPSDKWTHEEWLAVKRINVNPSNGPVPRLSVVYSDLSLDAPPAVSDLTSMGTVDFESFEHTGAVLSWKVNGSPSDEYRFYRIFITEAGGLTREAERYEVPLYDASCEYQAAELGLLKPETEYRIDVVAANPCAASQPVSVTFRTPAAQQTPPPPEVSIGRGDAHPARVSAKSFDVYVVDDISKVNPITGNLYEQGADGFEAEGPCGLEKYSNSLFDGSRLALTCVPGERLGFQLVVRNNTGAEKEFEARALNAQGIRIQFNKVWYIKCKGGWFPEVAVPMELAGFAVPFRENAIPGQKFQSLFVDVEIPKTLLPGRYSLSVELSAGAEKAIVPIEIAVEPMALESPDFVFDLNGYIAVPEYMGRRYGDPDFAKIEQAYYTEAWRHGLVINIVPYDQCGRMQAGFAPEVGVVDGALHVTDWSRWDDHFGKYLDGSYLLEATGRREPISHMFIPIHENWPLAIADYYKLTASLKEYPELVNELKLRSGRVADDFRPGYWEGIKEIFKDFIQHMDEKGWHGVTFQFYLNNKNFYKERKITDNTVTDNNWLVGRTIGNEGAGSSWWLLDEPNFRDDFEALAYFASAMKQAKCELGSGQNFRFRVDISGYNYMGTYLDGLIDIPVINIRGFAACERIARKRETRYGESGWIYGCFNDVDSSNLDSFMWTFTSYMKGGRGVVPWNNYAKDDEYDHPVQTACLYPGNRFGLDKPAISLRLKAARKCMEVIKYVETFKRVFGYSDLMMKYYVSNFFEMQDEAISRFRDDAGMMRFSGNNSVEAIESLKADLMRKLAAKISRT